MAQLQAAEQIRPAERTGRPGRIVGGFFLFTGGIHLGGSWAIIGWAGVIAFHLGLMLFGWGYWLWSVPALAFPVPSTIARWRRQQTQVGRRIQ